MNRLVCFGSSRARIHRIVIAGARRSAASTVLTWNPVDPLALPVSVAASSPSNTATKNHNSSSSWSQSVVGVMAATVIAAGGLWHSSSPHRTECSGIAAVVGTGLFDTRGFLLNGLTVFKNRGDDGAGLALVDAAGKMSVVKFAPISSQQNDQALEQVRAHSEHLAGQVGIAHTRWATHGGKIDDNVHPHLDSSGKIAIVHNGALHNVNTIRRELQKAGYMFRGQTDSEVIAKLIGHYYLKHPEAGVKVATEKALSQCEGTWGLVVMCSDYPDQLVVACNGSPLLIGVTGSAGAIVGSGNSQQQTTFIASEAEAFRRYTQAFVALRDGEIGVVKADGPELDNWSSLRVEQVEKSIHDAGDDDLDLQLTSEPYAHWTLREIYEQPEALGRTLCFGARLSDGEVHLGGFDKNKETMAAIQNLVLTGVGTSLHAAQYGAILMKQLGCFPNGTVTAIEASEADPQEFPEGLSACGIISQSGESKDLTRILQAADESGIPYFSVVNVVGSTLARRTKLGVYCHAGRERGVVSTKSFTSQVAALALISLWFRQAHKTCAKSTEADDLKEALMRLPMATGAALRTHSQVKEIAARFVETENCFVIGKGLAEPVAKQGATKLLELGYLHAEGSAAGAFKHGSLALIDDSATASKRYEKQTGFKATKPGTPVIVILLDDQHASSVRTAAEAVKARGGELIVITDKPSLAQGLDSKPIVIPSNGPLTAVGAVVPLQLLAYELSLLKGVNPDMPRNLSKAVLVD